MSDPANPTDDPAENAPNSILGEQFEPPRDSVGATDANGTNGNSNGNGAGSNGAPGSDADLRRLADVPMELSVEIGRTQITVGETLALRAGSVVTLDRLAGEPVDLLVNGTPIARGEVVVVDEQFGLRVTQIVNGDPIGHATVEAPGQDASDGEETGSHETSEA